MGVFNIQFESRVATDVGANQGIATDGDHFWVIGDGQGGGGTTSFTISEYDADWNLIQEKDLESDLPADATQMNGMTYHDGAIWAGGNNFPTTPAEKAWIFKINMHTLELEETHLLDEVAHGEGGAWRNGELWTCNNSNSLIYRYSYSGGVLTQIDNYDTGYVNDNNLFYQGLAWKNDYLICFLKGSDDNEFPHAYDVVLWNGTDFDKAGRPWMPTWEGPQIGCVQSGAIDPHQEYLYLAERDNTGLTHDVVRCTFNHAPNPTSTTFEDAIAAITDIKMHLKLREQSGTSLADAIGSHNGTLVGGRNLTACGDIMGYTKNGAGRGVMLDDNSDYIQISDHADLGGTTSFSFGGYFILRETPSVAAFLMGKGDSGEAAADNHNYALMTYFGASDKYTFLIEESDGTNHTVNSTTLPVADIPHFVVCVYDSDNNEMRIYVDGVLENTTSETFTPNTNSHPLLINGVPSVANLTEMAVFEPFFAKHALTDAEVTALWNAAESQGPITGNIFNSEIFNNCIFNNGEICVEPEGGLSGGRSTQKGVSVLQQDRSLGERPVLKIGGESRSKILVKQEGHSRSKLMIPHVINSEALIIPWFGGHSISSLQIGSFGLSESKLEIPVKGESNHSISANTILAAEQIKTNKLLKIEAILKISDLIDKIYDEELRAFTHSSVVVGNVSHDSETLKLRVHLNGILYEYDDVPARVFSAFEGSSSKGAFFARNIRDQYNFRKIG